MAFYQDFILFYSSLFSYATLIILLLFDPIFCTPVFVLSLFPHLKILVKDLHWILPKY